MLKPTARGRLPRRHDRVRLDKITRDETDRRDGPKRQNQGGETIGTEVGDHRPENHLVERDLVIAIDGPAAAGKTTVADRLARRIDALFFDTGVIYRALALLASEQGIDPDDADRLTEAARTLPVSIASPSVDDGRTSDVCLGERDVTWLIRSPEVDRVVSAISAHENVRAALLELQRCIGRSGRVVMVGRDIGTVVMPDADLKIWLDASLDERARRRTLDLERLGTPRTFEDVRAEMSDRDKIDAGRAVAPMKPADDAVVIVTDGLTIDQVVDRIVALLSEQTGAGDDR
jgi:cytidylate kinase